MGNTLHFYSPLRSLRGGRQNTLWDTACTGEPRTWVCRTTERGIRLQSLPQLPALRIKTHCLFCTPSNHTKAAHEHFPDNKRQTLESAAWKNLPGSLLLQPDYYWYSLCWFKSICWFKSPHCSRLQEHAPKVCHGYSTSNCTVSPYVTSNLQRADVSHSSQHFLLIYHHIDNTDPCY